VGRVPLSREEAFCLSILPERVGFRKIAPGMMLQYMGRLSHVPLADAMAIPCALALASQPSPRQGAVLGFATQGNTGDIATSLPSQWGAGSALAKRNVRFSRSTWSFPVISVWRGEERNLLSLSDTLLTGPCPTYCGSQEACVETGTVMRNTCAQPRWVLCAHTQTTALLSSGDILHFTDGTWGLQILRERLPEKEHICIAAAAGEKYVALLSNGGLCMITRDPELSWRLLAWSTPAISIAVRAHQYIALSEEKWVLGAIDSETFIEVPQKAVAVFSTPCGFLWSSISALSITWSERTSWADAPAHLSMACFFMSSRKRTNLVDAAPYSASLLNGDCAAWEDDLTVYLSAPASKTIAAIAICAPGAQKIATVPGGARLFVAFPHHAGALAVCQVWALPRGRLREVGLWLSCETGLVTPCVSKARAPCWATAALPTRLVAPPTFAVRASAADMPGQRVFNTAPSGTLWPLGILSRAALGLCDTADTALILFWEPCSQESFACIVMF
jgi:hypothetical protein